jgi:tRNA 2-selenouridine synthase
MPMAIEKLHIEEFLGLSERQVLLDVRSPAEYNHAHIPGAVNLPLFSDAERKTVGTVYKQQSREAAIKIGLDFFAPKMRTMVEYVESIVANRFPRDSSEQSGQPHQNGQSTANSLLIYCWRGGMRSAGVAWLMDLYGFKVYTLPGGYKRFRNYVLDTFKLPFQFNILGGYTGSGKTEMLKCLEEHGEIVIDLEEIVRHRGSAFGKIGSEKQPSQEMFENILAKELRAKAKVSTSVSHYENAEITNNLMTSDSMTHDSTTTIWIEDESQRIGDLNIPHELWKTIRQAPVYFLDIPFEERLNRIVKEYGDMDRDKLIDSILRIQKRLGGLEAKNAIGYLVEDNTVECFRILLKYYDKWYLKSLHNRENVNSLLVNIPCENVGLENIKALRRQALIS